MTVFFILMMILVCYVGGWFTTALAITQIGVPKRGCAPGCNRRRVDSRYYDSRPMWEGSHAVECNKPHFELVTATDAAGYALVWPYLWFYGVLALSERSAHQRLEKQQKLKARKDNPLTPEKLAEIDKILENTNMVVSDDGKIVHLKELER